MYDLSSKGSGSKFDTGPTVKTNQNSVSELAKRLPVCNAQGKAAPFFLFASFPHPLGAFMTNYSTEGSITPKLFTGNVVLSTLSKAVGST